MLTRTLPIQLMFLAGAIGLAGCGGPKPPDFPPLVPAKGVVKKGKEVVNGGTLEFSPETMLLGFVVTSPVGTDGTYSLTTSRTWGKGTESQPGAPAGKYIVSYRPPEGSSSNPVVLAAPVTVKGDDIPIDLAKVVDVAPKGIGLDKKGGVAPGKSK